jgi:hypothetical protein
MAAMEAAQTENTTVSKKVRRMFGLDLDAWNAVMVSFLGVAAMAAVVVGVSTAIIIKLQKQAELESSERIAKLTTDGDIARKETVQAKLELQQLRFPRRLDFTKLKAEIAGMPPQFFEVLYDRSAADGSSLASNIFVALRSIGWTTDQKLPAPLTPQQGPVELRDVYQLLPLTQQAGGAAWGGSVVTKGPISNDPISPERILGMALLATVDSPVRTVGGGKDETMPAGKIRIIVGPKLP